jgi:sterol desaturase/sphingolipid hydroxylase (fatty acid hydroxylase superfamily)
MHHFHFLWRWLHQLHHSPQRVDIPGAVVFHPFDMLQNNLVSIAVTVFVLGLAPEAAAWTGLVAIFYGLFQHWNVHTPRWLGYVIQRPESHCVHHTRNLHAYNYSDFPPWDMLMGTFRNPASFEGEAGFDDGATRRFGAMLIGRDVNPALDNGGGGQVA